MLARCLVKYSNGDKQGQSAWEYLKGIRLCMLYGHYSILVMNLLVVCFIFRRSAQVFYSDLLIQTNFIQIYTYPRSMEDSWIKPYVSLSIALAVSWPYNLSNLLIKIFLFDFKVEVSGDFNWCFIRSCHKQFSYNEKHYLISMGPRELLGGDGHRLFWDNLLEVESREKS